MPTFTLAQRNADLDARNAKQLARIAIETSTTMTTHPTAGATAGGDSKAMRGVPIQARGVGGTARGTDPHAAVGRDPD